jgi:hypothetical protein
VQEALELGVAVFSAAFSNIRRNRSRTPANLAY